MISYKEIDKYLLRNHEYIWASKIHLFLHRTFLPLIFSSLLISLLIFILPFNVIVSLLQPYRSILIVIVLCIIILMLFSFVFFIQEEYQKLAINDKKLFLFDNIAKNLIFNFCYFFRYIILFSIVFVPLKVFYNSLYENLSKNSFLLKKEIILKGCLVDNKNIQQNFYKGFELNLLALELFADKIDSTYAEKDLLIAKENYIKTTEVFKTRDCDRISLKLNALQNSLEDIVNVNKINFILLLHISLIIGFAHSFINQTYSYVNLDTQISIYLTLSVFIFLIPISLVFKDIKDFGVLFKYLLFIPQVVFILCTLNIKKFLSKKGLFITVYMYIPFFAPVSVILMNIFFTKDFFTYFNGISFIFCLLCSLGIVAYFNPYLKKALSSP